MKAFLIGSLFLTCFIAKVHATNLRGQIVRYDPNYGSNFAVPGVRVDLMVWNGAQWIPLGYSVTGNDGLYYFFNVQPNATFQIVVFGQFRLGQPMGVANINPPFFEDIPVINA
jgi:hypothetical protein